MTSSMTNEGTTSPSSAASQLTLAGTGRARRVVRAVRAGVSSVIGVISGVAPHVLHHVGPLAGAAIVTGGAGTALFGALGLIASLPFLWRLHRRTGGWRTPGVALVSFALMFALSALVIGPAISGGSGSDKPAITDEHSGHHPTVK